MASKKTPEINGGSMADISFLMLIFFLMVSTMDPAVCLLCPLRTLSWRT